MATAKKTPAKAPAKKAAAKPAVKPAAKAAPAKKAAAQAPAAAKPKAEKADKGDKAKKTKLVRDSFTIPKVEYAVLDELKQRAAKLGRPMKKSEVLRAGLKALAGMTDASLLATLSAVPAVKTGRPAKD